ncbi:unnamed protein product [Blepharisma stoltei]|uniref:Uncharacterized protein n=1 Tax=Blepharisma stoltei TaxID=1481888 RepID=A0AAU9JRS6_9CILI|nr:unnamed protein product [Blepharisma stoltei]
MHLLLKNFWNRNSVVLYKEFKEETRGKWYFMKFRLKNMKIDILMFIKKLKVKLIKPLIIHIYLSKNSKWK